MSQIVAAIEQHFGKMTVVQGQEHTFLGMEIVFNDNGTVRIGMKSYIKDAIKCFGEIVTKKVTTPAQKNIFELDSKSKKLDDARSDLFHTIVAKLLYMSKRGRPDIQLAVAFLCTRVNEYRAGLAETQMSVMLTEWNTRRVFSNGRRQFVGDAILGGCSIWSRC